ncbi:uncharacterized protein LOC144118632 [Amblyomma americanum]
MAVAILQRYMKELLHGIDGVLVFLDDILIGGKDEVQHYAHLQEVLKRIHEDGLRLKFDKCQFCVEEVCYLRFRVNSAGAAHVLEPLCRLLDKGREWHWTEAEADAFCQARGLLQSSHVLVHYNVNKPLVLACDASPHGLGAVLSHVGEDGRLLHHAKPQVLSPRMLRWTLMLSAYDYEIEYRPAELSNADAFNCLPLRASKSPAKLLMGRKLSTVLERLHPDLQSGVQQEQVMQRRNQAVRLFEVGDRVFMRNYLYGPKWLPGIVDAVTGPVSYLVVTKDGRQWRRHVDQLRSRSASYALDSSTSGMSEEEEPLVASLAGCSELGIPPSPEDPGRRDQGEIREEAATPSTESGSCGEDREVSASLQVQRPQRQHSHPAYLKDFVM